MKTTTVKLELDGEKFGREYVTAELVLVDDEIFAKRWVHHENCGFMTFLIKVDKALVLKCQEKGREDFAELFEVIRPRESFVGDDRYDELCNVNHYVVKAMKVYDITHEKQTDVGRIKGLTMG